MYAELATSMKAIAKGFKRQLQALQSQTEELSLRIATLEGVAWESSAQSSAESGAANSGTNEEEPAEGLEAGNLETSDGDMGKSPKDSVARALQWAAEAPVSMAKKRAALEAVFSAAQAKETKRRRRPRAC